MQKLKLISPMPPSVNHYLSYRVIIKKSKPIVVCYKTPAAIKYQKEFKEHVVREVENQNYNLKLDKKQHFYVDAVFYFDRVDKDANNYFKCLLDAITDTQLVWVNDNVACERVQGIYYDSKNPRIELEIYPVGYIGIFEDVYQLKSFESNCAECRRYERNCSILQKAKDGRIQEEIRGLKCNKFNPC